jgi:bacterioferritin-associated ferredoxin
MRYLRLMFVCNCNGIRCGEVQEAIQSGARTPQAVHRRRGCKAQCGRCLPEIADRIREARAADKADETPVLQTA